MGGPTGSHLHTWGSTTRPPLQFCSYYYVEPRYVDGTEGNLGGWLGVGKLGLLIHVGRLHGR